MTKSREVCAAKAGPPKGPFALRVSAMRQGVMGTNSDAVCPFSVTVKVNPAMVNVPDLGAAEVSADAVKETAPLPVPLEPELIVIQSALLIAVHAQLAAEAVTPTDELPPAPLNAALEALSVKVHEPPLPTLNDQVGELVEPLAFLATMRQ